MRGLPLLLLFVVWTLLCPLESGAVFFCRDIHRDSPPRVAFDVDLQREIRDSGLERHLDVIRAHARGITDIYGFLREWPLHKQGYLLGISEGQMIYGALSGRMGLLGWPDGYSKHRIFPRANGHTETYMQAITATGEPIVFLVPRDLMARPGITQSEMLWLLAHPGERLHNVTLVFGAYDFLSPALLAEMNRRGNHNALREFLKDSPWARPAVNP